MSSHPAQLLKLAGRGTLAAGAHADLVLFNPTATWTYAAAQSLSKSKNSPFDQAPMLGRIHATLVGGRVVHRH
jgi:dihydroorotase